jgi:hypothetical protein
MNEGKQNLHKIQECKAMCKWAWMSASRIFTIFKNMGRCKNENEYCDKTLDDWRMVDELKRVEEMRRSKVQEWSNRTVENANRKQWDLWISKQEWQKLEGKWVKRWDCTRTMYSGSGLLKTNEWNKGSFEGASVNPFDSWGVRTGIMRFMTHEWNNWTLHDTRWGTASTEVAWQKQYIRPLRRSGKKKIVVFCGSLFFNVCHSEVFNTNIQWCTSQTQQNFIMFIIVLGQHVSILIESSSSPSNIQILT